MSRSWNDERLKTRLWCEIQSIRVPRVMLRNRREKGRKWRVSNADRVRICCTDPILMAKCCYLVPFQIQGTDKRLVEAGFFPSGKRVGSWTNQNVHVGVPTVAPMSTSTNM